MQLRVDVSSGFAPLRMMFAAWHSGHSPGRRGVGASQSLGAYRRRSPCKVEILSRLCTIVNDCEVTTGATGSLGKPTSNTPRATVETTTRQRRLINISGVITADCQRLAPS
jgi:hypothetical protein